MSQYNIDIDEQDWLDKYGNEVVERLLWEHSREQYVDDNGEKCHHHIYWATENYEQNGFTYIPVLCIIGLEIMVSKDKSSYSSLTVPPLAGFNAQNTIVSS